MRCRNSEPKSKEARINVIRYLKHVHFVYKQLP